MPQHIKAIETHYAGCRFRSRLEARWAIFFDTLGIRWEYEPEGFETSAGRYLPDFRIELYFSLPTWTWFEVKPEGAPDDPRHVAFVGAGNFLTIARGMARDDADQFERDYLITHDSPTWSSATVSQRVGFYCMPGTGYTTTFCEMIEPDIPNRWIDAAYTAARSARFEFGETGR